MAKVYQLKLVKQKLGKYSKVMGYDETMLDETIEVQPEAECVKDDIKTAALEVMDVVDIPKANGESEEVVVVETPKSDDTTIKVQSTETGVTADVPVEAFSKATKISKAKIKAYSEAEAEAKEAEKKEDEPKAEEKPAEEAKEEPKSEEKKDEGELKTESEEGKEGEEPKSEEEKKSEAEPKDKEKPEEKSEGEEEKEKLETNSLAISLSTGKVYAYSCEEGKCEEIINEDGELDTVEDLKEYSGYSEVGAYGAVWDALNQPLTGKTYKKGLPFMKKKEVKGRNALQALGDAFKGRDSKAMERMAKKGIKRDVAKKLEKSFHAPVLTRMPRLAISALVNAGEGINYVKALFAKLGGLKGIADKKRDLESLIGQVNGKDPEDIKKVASKLTTIAANEGALDKVAEVKQDYKDKLAAASKTCYSKFFAYKNAPICLGVYSEESNEIVEAKEAEAEKAEEKAEAAAEVAEKASEVEQPQGTEKLPIVIEKVDNGYTITANGETKVADDVKSICNIVTELLEETKMDSYSKMAERFRNFLNG